MQLLLLLLTCGRCTMQISYITGAAFWPSSSSYLLAARNLWKAPTLSHFVLNKSVNSNLASRSFIVCELTAINLSNISASGVKGHYLLFVRLAFFTVTRAAGTILNESWQKYILWDAMNETSEIEKMIKFSTQKDTSFCPIIQYQYLRTHLLSTRRCQIKIILTVDLSPPPHRLLNNPPKTQCFICSVGLLVLIPQKSHTFYHDLWSKGIQFSMVCVKNTLNMPHHGLWSWISSEAKYKINHEPSLRRKF